MKNPVTSFLSLSVLLLVPAARADAQGWSTFRHDNRRSGVTKEQLAYPLELDWVWTSPQPPQTAWSGPAKWDAYSGNRGLQSMRNFDPCFYVTADSTGVFFGSSADDAVHALDAKSGDESWIFFTGAPVRLPPTIDGNRLLFGSDDGYAYCCEKSSGEELWKVQARKSSQRIMNDRKIISLWPVRTGVLVDRGLATFGGSLVPWESSYLLTVDAKSGSGSGPGCFRRELTDVTLQGALLASSELFYVPQGRAAPLAFRRADGEPRGAVGEAGGVFCILTEDEMLLAGPPDQKSDEEEIRIADLQSNRAIASFAGTNRILVDKSNAWLSIGGELKSLNRQQYIDAQRSLEAAADDLKHEREKVEVVDEVLARAKSQQSSAWKWTIPCPPPLELIKAGDVILVGLDGLVVAFAESDGREVWRAQIEGAAHGLAVASGRLYVSTDRGSIYAFGAAR